MRNVTLAATQMACGWEREANIAAAEALVREAHGRGAQVVLLQELFETPYFCKDEADKYFALAEPIDRNPAVARMRQVARELAVVVPVSIFEREGERYYNTLVLVDADGGIAGRYRKSHIPRFPGYHENYYFRPGDTGFLVAETRYGRIGAAVCWDQWFPEAARCMALMGAEVLLYPTAIGSEPLQPALDSKAHWQHVMQGHAAANLIPVVASNRVGVEPGESCTLTFYGSSFIADHHGNLLVEAPSDARAVITATVDLDAVADARARWGVFQTRRPDLYARIAQDAKDATKSRAPA
jgi:N-carbamoylputrescine amidase